METALIHLSAGNGTVAVRDTGGPGQPIVLLHGSGTSGSVFNRQFESPLAGHFRLIALDLPGHGASSDFSTPADRWTLPTAADLVASLLERLEIECAVIMGWSLGGHIAIEMMARHPQLLAGVMACGTPPLDGNPITQLRAFRISRAVLLIHKPRFTHSDAARFARMCFGPLAQPHHIAQILRANGDMRVAMIRSILCTDANQKQIVETSPIPLAMVNGADEPAIRTGYIAGLSYANLWDGKCHLIPGGGHAPFHSTPFIFNALLHRFATDVWLKQSTPGRPLAARRA